LITLYHRPNTRSTRFIFLLEELEAPYEIRLVSTRTRDGGAPPTPPILIRTARCRRSPTTGWW
jgi:glutathione S-transferase